MLIVYATNVIGEVYKLKQLTYKDVSSEVMRFCCFEE